ncbi:putative quinol monooxygenase [Sphaerisporangium sp. NPDC049003]|uniref:putative quinol monooxygenase n=1 Tax=Sphaerisporangium sp. NPDC049003 TaxID=3364517 RepID=UPI003724BEE0
MTVNYGFNATLTAKPGMGDQVVELLRSGLNEGNPAASEHCAVYLICRSASDPDVIHVTEGWTSEEEHHRLFATEAAKAIVAQFDALLAKESDYTDYVPVVGKPSF